MTTARPRKAAPSTFACGAPLIAVSPSTATFQPNWRNASGFCAVMTATCKPKESTQSAVPSPSESVSGVPQPHWPGAVFNESFGQPSLQSAVPSRSLSVSGIPQPHCPGATLFRSPRQRSRESGVPSLSSSRSEQSAIPSPSMSASATPSPSQSSGAVSNKYTRPESARPTAEDAGELIAAMSPHMTTENPNPGNESTPVIVASWAHCVPVRLNTRQLPASAIPSTVSSGSETTARVAVASSATLKPRPSPAAPSGAINVASAVQVLPLVLKMKALPRVNAPGVPNLFAPAMIRFA